MNETSNDQMRAFERDARALFGEQGDFSTHIDDNDLPGFAHAGTQAMFIGWLINQESRDAEKKALSQNPLGLQAYRIEILVIGDPLKKPQIITSAAPDMTTEQWAALGERLRDSAGSAHTVNVDELIDSQKAE